GKIPGRASDNKRTLPTGACMREVPFVFPDLAGKKVLFLGLGGGCDVITAFAVAKLAEGRARAAVYAHTKTSSVARLQPIPPHILRVAGPVLEPGRQVRGYGRTKIDHSVPRGPDGCPWIFVLDRETAERELVGEVRSLGFDVIFGVDTGGDSIARKRGRGHRGR